MTSRLPLGSKSAVLLFFLLLTPCGVLAAEDAPLASLDTATTSQTEEHRLSLLEAPAPEAGRRRAPFGLRLLAEVGGGVAMTAAGGIAGIGLCLLTIASAGEIGCYYALLLGAVTGLSVGYPIGAWWGGEAVGGDGRLWASFVGGFTGFVLGVVATASRGEMVLAIPLLTMVGSSLGYELSLRPEYPGRTAASPRIQPLLALGARGGMLGLSARF
ncbi:hypothetical protein F0U60_04335 [Archangium minus]|uniref:Uncharacterized protein n=1 Tax=Archangium minus TaxID=83450 RepID=A0ABY9WI05_9BACT|nr:hypothetical protein F0U60_04335 [Archangium minus]